MTELQDQMLELIQRHAAGKVAELANEYVRASPAEKEAILAGMDFERWLEQSCRECLLSRNELR